MVAALMLLMCWYCNAMLVTNAAAVPFWNHYVMFHCRYAA